MKAETANRDSVPAKGPSVKSVMVSLLSDLPVVCGEYTAVLGDTITSASFSVACTRLLGVQRQVIVRARFQLGDLWNQWQTDAFRVERTAWLAALRLRIPNEEDRAKYLRPFRECGWVASKWPVSERSDRHCWTYWVENPKGDERLGVERATKYVRGVERVVRDDGECIEMLLPSEELIVWRVCDLPVRDERTVKP